MPSKLRLTTDTPRKYSSTRGLALIEVAALKHEIRELINKRFSLKAMFRLLIGNGHISDSYTYDTFRNAVSRVLEKQPVASGVDGVEMAHDAQHGEEMMLDEVSSSESLMPFAFNDALIRVQSDSLGHTWFVAKDVCRVLAISNHNAALASLDGDEKGVAITDPLTPGGAQQVRTVSESGLYSLIFRSRKPEAQAFRKWVTGTVLPAIRKTGRYRVSSETTEKPLLPVASVVPGKLGLLPETRVKALECAVQAAKLHPDASPELIEEYYRLYCSLIVD